MAQVALLQAVVIAFFDTVSTRDQQVLQP